MARLAVAIGDPTGIGPEVLAKALAARAPREVLLIGDPEAWEAACRLAGVDLPLRSAARPGPVTPEGVPFLEVRPDDRAWRTGEMSPAAGRAAATWLGRAVRLALDGQADAVVFAPLNKQAIIRAGRAVRDEYDLCARLAGVDDHDEVNTIPHPALQSGDGAGGSGRGGPSVLPREIGRDPDRLLWVVRVTGHVPFRDVPGLLTTERVLRTIRLADTVASRGASREAAGRGPTAQLSRRPPRRPVVAVAALNPHAGEGGLLGDEEARVIAPAIAAARAEGIDATGPIPADHVFRIARGGLVDAVVALYHDQAQIATKLLGFDRGVSVGVGYPFVLATPSHGTAFDIAGRGVADARPMQQALAIAERLCGA